MGNDSCCSNFFFFGKFSMFAVFRCLWQRPHYAEEIWKRSFISIGRLTGHKNPSRKAELFENALQIGGSLNRRLFVFLRVDWKHFENGAFRKRLPHDNHVISLTESSSKTNQKWSVIFAFLNSSMVVRMELKVFERHRCLLPHTNITVSHMLTIPLDFFFLTW